MSTAATKVRAILVAAGVKDIPDTLVFKRTYAGHNQRSEGAWSWYCTDADGREYCGSQWPLGKLKPGSVDVGAAFGAYDLSPTTKRRNDGKPEKHIATRNHSYELGRG